MAFQQVAKLSEIPDGGIKGVVVDGEQVALFRLDGDVFALSDVCTHEGCIISDNHDIQGDIVECACHGSRFKIKTGDVEGPPALEPLKKYEVKIDGDEVMVDVS